MNQMEYHLQIKLTLAWEKVGEGRDCCSSYDLHIQVVFLSRLGVLGVLSLAYLQEHVGVAYDCPDSVRQISQILIIVIRWSMR